MKKSVYDLTPEEVEFAFRKENKAYDICCNKDWRQGWSHSGYRKYETWDDIEHEQSLRRTRHNADAYIADALRAEGDEYDAIAIILAEQESHDEYTLVEAGYAQDYYNTPHAYPLKHALKVAYEKASAEEHKPEPDASNLVYNELTGEFEEIKQLNAVYLSPRHTTPESDGLCKDWEVSLILAGAAASVFMAMLLMAF